MKSGLRILSLDLATNVGWASNSGDTVSCGAFTLEGESQTEKLLDLEERLSAPPLRRSIGLADVIVLEMPHLRGAGSYWLVGLNVITKRYAFVRGVPVIDVHSGTVKRRFAGHGRASKKDMVKAAKETWPALTIPSHDAADALAMLWVVDEENAT